MCTANMDVGAAILLYSRNVHRNTLWQEYEDTEKLLL